MTLDQMAERIAGSASSPGEFLFRKQDALHYLNAVRCEGYRAGIEAAAKLCDDAAAVPGTGRDGSVALSAAAYCIRALAPKEGK